MKSQSYYRMHTSVFALAVASGLALTLVPSEADAGLLKKARKAVGKTAGQVVKPVVQATKPVQQAVQQVVRNPVIIVAPPVVAVAVVSKPVEKEVEKKVDKIQKEIANAGRDINEAAIVASKAPERVAEGVKAAAEQAAHRLEEGKFLDAAWHLHKDIAYGVQEDVAFQSMQESTTLRMVGQAVASTYGGPAGAAAFAAWYTYRATDGDLEEAVKAGAIAYVAAEANDSLRQFAPSGLAEHAGKAVASGIVGGAATAAAGGEFEEGFKQSAWVSVGQSLYQMYTGYTPNPNSGSEGYAKEPGVDMRSLDPTRNHVGKFNEYFIEGRSDYDWDMEGSWFMRGVNRVPGANGMAYLHDIWSQDWHMPVGINELTIIPATIATWHALGFHRDVDLVDEAARQ